MFEIFLVLVLVLAFPRIAVGLLVAAVVMVQILVPLALLAIVGLVVAVIAL